MSQTETSEVEAIDPDRGTSAPSAPEHTAEEDPAVSLSSKVLLAAVARGHRHR